MESRLHTRRAEYRSGALRLVPAKRKVGAGVKTGRCKKKSCIYHTGEHKEYGCNYAGVTGHTRIAQLPEELQDPAVCPLYKRGKRRRAIPMP